MRVILLILIGLSSLSFAEFNREGDIVTDSISLLQWQDDDIGSTMEWQEAIDYCENTLTLGGYNDWRLPNINELKSIVDQSKYNPAVVNGFINTISSDYYWSSTSIKKHSDGAFIVDFNNGDIFFHYPNAHASYYKDHNYYVRCVRAGR